MHDRRVICLRKNYPNGGRIVRDDRMGRLRRSLLLYLLIRHGPGFGRSTNCRPASIHNYRSLSSKGSQQPSAGRHCPLSSLFRGLNIVFRTGFWGLKVRLQ